MEEKYADVEASLDDIDFVHEVKVSQKQKDLYKLGVEKHGFNKKYKGGYYELVDALKREKKAKADSLAAHVEEMALFDLKINYLTVKSKLGTFSNPYRIQKRCYHSWFEDNRTEALNL